MRLLALLATVSLGLATIVKAAQVALTPDRWAALYRIGAEILASDGFGFLLGATAFFFFLYCSAAAWERAERGESTCGYCGHQKV